MSIHSSYNITNIFLISKSFLAKNALLPTLLTRTMHATPRCLTEQNASYQGDSQ